MRSMIRLNRMMLMAKGQRPTPKISPFWVSLRLNSTPQSPMICARTMNPNDVAMREMKQVQKTHFCPARPPVAKPTFFSSMPFLLHACGVEPCTTRAGFPEILVDGHGPDNLLNGKSFHRDIDPLREQVSSITIILLPPYRVTVPNRHIVPEIHDAPQRSGV